ncbi:hypothetical protein MAR_029224 [Mya arenaria]|uniref:Uncharacterized protein n=1 Tax=Mya arenaria TaxID=6604 RepID=A0ABY7DGV2_MYAAR|nr:hypothetical protein MAR_029224 [Mya arenaria]
MHSQKRHVLPDKPIPVNGKLSGPQKLYTDLMDFVDELGCGWTVDLISSGQKALRKLADALWYIDHVHSRFKDKGCPIPSVFEKFLHYNQFSKHHHTPPVIKTERLSEICSDLADDLNATLAKYNESLIKNKKLQEKSRTLDPSDEGNANGHETSCQYILPGNVDDVYADLDEYMSKQGEYEYVDLDDFSPSNRYKTREYVKKLKISKPVMLYRVAYGGCVGTLNFIWRVLDTDSKERFEKNGRIISSITESLVKFSSRQMQRDFINKYIDYVKCPKSVLRNMFFDVSGFETTAENSEQKNMNERVAEIVFGSDDPKLILDMRAMNEYDEAGKYFDEQIMHVHERRKTDELYMPLSISIEDLREEIMERLPDDTPVPSTESLRLQFTPANQFSQAALKYSSRLNVKFRVQTRLARVHHQDAHYVAAYYKYMKHFCRQYTLCLDDKAIVPIGEPSVPISTGVRGHNKVLTQNDGPRLVASDHDFHIGGIVPSVVLVSDISENPSDSFFIGHVFVSSKDKVFEPSTPFRHATELTRLLQENFYENSLDLDHSVLCILTDGGPDHRLTYDSVKTSLLEIFLHLILTA